MSEQLALAPLLISITPKTEADRERLDRGLRVLCVDDPMLRVRTDPTAPVVILGAVGETQLEIVLDRLRREFSVEASVGRPQVVYKELRQHEAGVEIVVLLEPVMRLEVSVPLDWITDVLNDLAIRRGRLMSQRDRDGTWTIHAHVPLSEMFGYATDLRARTRGRGSYSMQLAGWEACTRRDDAGTDYVNRGARVRPRPRPGDRGVALPEPDED